MTAVDDLSRSTKVLSWLEAALPFERDPTLSHRIAAAVWQQGRLRMTRRFKQA